MSWTFSLTRGHFRATFWVQMRGSRAAPRRWPGAPCVSGNRQQAGAETRQSPGRPRRRAACFGAQRDAAARTGGAVTSRQALRPAGSPPARCAPEAILSPWLLASGQWRSRRRRSILCGSARPPSASPSLPPASRPVYCRTSCLSAPRPRPRVHISSQLHLR